MAVHLITELRELMRARRLVLFAGAGISVDPPSGLRLANDLVRQVQRHLLGPLAPDLPIRTLRPEVVFRTFAAHDPDVLLAILTAFHAGHAFNKNHLLCAYLLRRGMNVITTNFDMLIESAYAALASRSEKGAPRPGLLRLHGSIARPRSMLFTIDHINRGLPAGIRKSLARAVRGKTILVLGYSGLDQLDVMPALCRCEHDKIVWVNHEGGAAREIRTSPLNRWVAALPRLEHWACNTPRLVSQLLPVELAGIRPDRTRERAVVNLLIQQGLLRQVLGFIERRELRESLSSTP